MPHTATETIDGVRPLTEWERTEPDVPIPGPLRGLMFAPVPPTEGEWAAARKAKEAVPPLRTYAVLDAAKVVNLPELLDTSDLLHRCLFQGAAAEDLRDVAPWLVELEEANRFTRCLVTEGDAPWQLWDREAGIVLRSRAPMDAVLRHLRRFTRVQDEMGKWFYLRLWEPRLIGGLAEILGLDDPSAPAPPFRAIFAASPLTESATRLWVGGAPESTSDLLTAPEQA